MFRLFERLLHPYPEAEPPHPPAGFFSFMWACTEGLRGYILALAALNMRSVLVDHARARQSQRRGGGALVVTLSRAEPAAADSIDVDLLALDQALTALASRDARTARSVELFYFGGMERDEIALELGVSVPTVDRDLRFARAWLNRELA